MACRQTFKSLNPPPDEEEILIPFSLLSSPAGFPCDLFPPGGFPDWSLGAPNQAGCPQGWKVWKNFGDV